MFTEYSTLGFNATYYTVNCERNCDVNRHCVNGTCVCTPGHAGDLCDVTTFVIDDVDCDAAAGANGEGDTDNSTHVSYTTVSH